MNCFAGQGSAHKDPELVQEVASPSFLKLEGQVDLPSTVASGRVGVAVIRGSITHGSRKLAPSCVDL